jgi:hypothetical protein
VDLWDLFQKTMIAKNDPVSLCHIGFMPKMSRLWMKPMISIPIAVIESKAPRAATTGIKPGGKTLRSANSLMFYNAAYIAA